MATQSYPKAVNTSPFYSVQLRKFGMISLLMMLAFTVTFVYLLPFGNMVLTAIKSNDQLTGSADSSIFPIDTQKFTYNGQAYPLYNVPTDNGTKPMALIKPGRQSSQFIDPANPSAEPLVWKGNWRGLEAVSVFTPHYENFQVAWDMINFPLLFGNTMFIAITGMIGTLLSSICVAYAFARFPIPGKNILFIILIGTIILPGQVTLIPTYAFFNKIGWIGTWAPLIVPHFFANAYNVFLLRQYFLTLPKALDEAAMIDGASPLQVLLRVIIPQSWPVIISVGLFHFIFAWNDYFGPLIYLLGKENLIPISVGVQKFNFTYGPHPEWVQATSLMAMVLPLIIFFLCQKFFMRGIVITGVEK